MIDALIEAVTRYTDAQTGASPYATAIPGFAIMRSDGEGRLMHVIHKPAICMVLQGGKWSMFAGRRLDYRAGQALIVSVKMPALARVAPAGPGRPYLAVAMEVDPVTLREVYNEIDGAPVPASTLGKSVFLMEFDGALADCALRLLRLLETPKAIPVLSPSIMREICYWLLTGPHGAEFYSVAMAGGPASGVIECVHALRDRYAEPVRIEELARLANMSPSAFHQRFKALMGTTPLQYQKQIRLFEARRLLVSTEINVETAASKVGYESPSQFSREYSRMFGNSPRRDAALAPD